MYRLVLFVLLAFSLTACTGGGDGDSETMAWVTISSPANGYITNADTIVVEGNAAYRDGSYPIESVYWYNGGTSGVADKSVVCILACLMAWRASVPLYLGDNTITLQFVDANASLQVTRKPTVTAEGRISLPSSLGAPDVTVAIVGAGLTASTRTDSGGNYSLVVYDSGSYVLTPSLPLPQSAGCLDFDPASLTVDVGASDVSGQDFTATELTGCYAISGRITASTNPSAGQSGVTVTLVDAGGHEMSVVTDADGYYSVHQLAPGTYTITPRDCILSFCSTFVPDSVAATITSGDLANQDFVRQF